jgi:hypothetical protein
VSAATVDREVVALVELRTTTKCSAFGECGATLSKGSRAWLFSVDGELRFACYECAANAAPRVKEVSK